MNPCSSRSVGVAGLVVQLPLEDEVVVVVVKEGVVGNG